MDQRGMKQADLKDVLPRPNSSAILNGCCAISRAVANQLAEQFNVAITLAPELLIKA
jgi:antitoxin component HigA of HigAB toxin-antitoxin module